MLEAKSPRLRIFYILEYLKKNSHETHPVKTAELIKMLEDYGITCDRKTIYADIAALQEYGEDIISIPGRSGGYYYAAPSQFELAELKLLIDAVTSSRFLTENKSHKLVEKLCDLCNEHDANLMRRSIVISKRVKSMNESIYYNVSDIQDAIVQNLQISFRYFDWGMDGKRHYREKEYLASPYGLCQDNENCYLLAYSERHGITSYRVDRMTDIVITDKKRYYCAELSGKALNDHANRLFQMYSGEAVDVKLRFHRSLINIIIDRFGTDVMLIPDGEEHLTFVTKVAVSPMFLSWMIGFGEKAQVLYPQSVVDACKTMCQKALEQYP